MGSEVGVALAWLYSTLKGDSTLTGYAPGGVWRGEAQPSTTPPFVVLIYLPSNSHDEVVFGGARAYSDLFFDVLACGPADAQRVAPVIVNAAARIDTLLTVSTQTAITGGTILACFRSVPLEADPLINGETWTNMGGTYRIMIKAT
jgi:hypothetical protein